VRVYGQHLYGIPPARIIGSSLMTKYEIEIGRPELMRMPKLFFNCNFDGRVIGIDQYSGAWKIS
jgi:hypothetical protein